MSTLSYTRLWEFVAHWAEEKPDDEALVFGEQRITWREFDTAVERTAKAFLEAGVERGDRIGLVAMGCPEFLITFIAASKVGAIWLGLSPKFTVDELRFILADAQPTILITLRDYAGIDLVKHGLTFGSEFPSIQQVMVIGPHHEGTVNFAQTTADDRPDFDAALQERIARVSSDDNVLLMYTSGSTGKPKGVLHSHASIIRNIEAEVKYFDFGRDSRCLLHFPINHVAADVEIGFGSIYAGGTLILMDRFDAQESLEVIESERVTVVGQVPVMFLMQMHTPKFREMNWEHVRAFIWGGSAASEQMVDVLMGIAGKTGARLITGYGSTELCGFCTYTAPDDSREDLLRSCGRVAPEFELRIVDEERTPVPANTVGEIAVRGGIVMSGYLNNPGATAAVLDEDGWYYTSDLGSLDERGYLYITGRASEMYKTGGENVYPREIEDVLERHPAVLFAAVIGIEDPLYDEVGHAFIMHKPGQQCDESEIRQFCKEHLANFKVPKRFELRPQLPLLPNGKVNKMALKAQLAAAQD